MRDLPFSCQDGIMTSSSPAGCLTDETVLELLGGSMPPLRESVAHAHIAECSSCRELVAEAVRTPERSEGPHAAPTTRGGAQALVRRPSQAETCQVEPSDMDVGPPTVPGEIGRYLVRKPTH